MKKIILIAISFLPLLTRAQEGIVKCGNDGVPCTYTDIVKKGGLLDSIVEFLALKIAVPLTVLAIVIAGLMLTFVPLKPENKNLFKKTLNTSIIGLFVTLSAFLIVKLLVYGVSGGEPAEFLKTLF